MPVALIFDTVVWASEQDAQQDAIGLLQLTPVDCQHFALWFGANSFLITDWWTRKQILHKTVANKDKRTKHFAIGNYVYGNFPFNPSAIF